jgi:hypothetical protein
MVHKVFFQSKHSTFTGRATINQTELGMFQLVVARNVGPVLMATAQSAQEAAARCLYNLLFAPGFVAKWKLLV